jgi:hypothetical protein
MNMSFLFWILWIINLMLVALAILGKGFRSSFGAGIDLNVLVIIVLLAILAVSLILKFAFKQKWTSLVVVSLPLLAVLVLYVFDKVTGKSI